MVRNTIQQCTQYKLIACIYIAVYEKSTLSMLIAMKAYNLIAYSVFQTDKPSDQRNIYYLLITFELTQLSADYYLPIQKLQLFMPVIPINHFNAVIQKQTYLYQFATSKKRGHLGLTEFFYGLDVVELKSLTNYKKMIDAVLVSDVDSLPINGQLLEGFFTCCSISYYIIVRDRLGGNSIKKEVNIARSLTKLGIA